jgi:hypothetical protein
LYIRNLDLFGAPRTCPVPFPAKMKVIHSPGGTA